MITINSKCPICLKTLPFSSDDDYVSCRSQLRSPGCPYHTCSTRERAIAKVLRKTYKYNDFKRLKIHQAAPAPHGLSVWLKNEIENYTESGFFPEKNFGTLVNNLQNENLEHQTFKDESFDLVLHLDVLEHVYQPFLVLQEIERTLKKGGKCIFTTPTYFTKEKSEQVAFVDKTGKIDIKGPPEYHGNPQDPEGGALVTWRFGYDLPLLISRKTNFDVDVYRWQSKSDAIMGPMNEVYLLTKQ